MKRWIIQQSILFLCLAVVLVIGINLLKMILSHTWLIVIAGAIASIFAAVEISQSIEEAERRKRNVSNVKRSSR